MSNESGLNIVVSKEEYSKQGIDFGKPIFNDSKTYMVFGCDSMKEAFREVIEETGCDALVWNEGPFQPGFYHNFHYEAYRFD